MVYIPYMCNSSIDIIEEFSKHLTSIEYPDVKTSWNIAGIIKGHNAFYRFDVREMFKLPNGNIAQNGKTNTKADKMVLKMDNEWVILDLKELNTYVKKHKIKILYLESLLKNLDWNIIINK